MSADDFFSRWSRRAAEAKASAMQAQESADKQAPVGPGSTVTEANIALPPRPSRDVTLEDVAALTKDSDYSAFVAKGVDEAVKRSAMKKLFADPHFNVMDGLDIYIDDYSIFEPITPAALALMEHAKPLLDPLGQLQNSVSSLLSTADEEKAPSESQDKEREATVALSVEEQKNIQVEEGADMQTGLTDPVEPQPPGEPSSPA